MLSRNFYSPRESDLEEMHGRNMEKYELKSYPIKTLANMANRIIEKHVKDNNIIDIFNDDRFEDTYIDIVCDTLGFSRDLNKFFENFDKEYELIRTGVLKSREMMFFGMAMSDTRLEVFDKHTKWSNKMDDLISSSVEKIVNQHLHIANFIMQKYNIKFKKPTVEGGD